MKIYTYGDKNKQALVMLHPMMADHNILLNVFKPLTSSFFLIIPDLSDHGEDKNPYLSSVNEAQSLVSFLKEKKITSPSLYGASLGARIGMDLIKDRELTFSHIILDGLCLYSDNKPARDFLNNMFLSVYESDDSFKAREFLRSFYGEQYKTSYGERFLKMKRASIVNCLLSCTTYNFTDISEELQQKTVLFYGEKEDDYLPVSKTFRKLYPQVKIEVFKNRNHMEKLVKDSSAYFSLVKDILLH